jgi:hypothetical protein
MREMALMDTGDFEMVWRDGGLDIFVSGEVLEGDNAGGRGVTQLRVDDLEGNLPQIRTGDGAHVLTARRVETSSRSRIRTPIRSSAAMTAMWTNLICRRWACFMTSQIWIFRAR